MWEDFPSNVGERTFLCFWIRFNSLPSRTFSSTVQEGKRRLVSELQREREREREKRVVRFSSWLNSSIGMESSRLELGTSCCWSCRCRSQNCRMVRGRNICWVERIRTCSISTWGLLKLLKKRGRRESVVTINSCRAKAGCILSKWYTSRWHGTC